jgi:serine/threonine-protein kinase
MEQPDTTDLIDRLDAYVSELRAGRSPDKRGVIAQDPNFAGILACLEDLELLARAAIGEINPVGAGDVADSRTLARADAEVAEPGSDEIAPTLSRIGKYELLEVVGRGGMGVVYKARQTDLNRLVAVKLILASQLASPAEVVRFETEARAAAGLRHPHILQVHEAGQVLGQHYFAMEYVEGLSLAEVLRKGPLAPDQAAECLGRVAGAVAYLHTRGIIHRDLKPSNILLDAERRPYVTDFGLVKMLGAGSDLTSTGAILGTPSYMAPEQAAGRNAAVDALSDVYSLGAILYEALTGRPPYRGATPLDTLAQVLESEPASCRSVNPAVPPELELVCQKAMSKAPEERYTSAGDLADDLERYLRGEPVLARPQSYRQRIIRWARRETGLASRLAVIAACAAIAQVYYSMNHQVPLAAHALIMAILGLWILVSIACQGLIRRDVQPERVRRLWLAADGILLTTALIVDDAYTTPLVLCYGVFIVASALWFRVSLVWYTTTVAVAGYVLLIVVGAYRGQLGESPQHHLIALVTLILLGVMVASQVKRVRALSRHYEHRPLE